VKICSQPSHLTHTSALYFDIDLNTSTLLRAQRGQRVASAATSIFSTLMSGCANVSKECAYAHCRQRATRGAGSGKRVGKCYAP
jgi:hypothetical protein